MAEAVTPPAPVEWTAEFDDTTKGYVQNKGFKTAQDLARSYMNLEKLQGAGPDKLLKLPDSMDSDEAKPVWEKLGLPKEAKDYGLDPKEHGSLAEDFLAANITKSQAERYVSKRGEAAKAALALAEEADRANQLQIDQQLKTEWGQAYDRNKQIVDQVTTKMGITVEQLKAMGQSLGRDKTMKMLLDLGMKTGEHTFVQGHAANEGVMEPAAARQRIQELRQDPGWVNKYLSGDSEARKTMGNLQAMAYPGEVAL